MERRMYKGSEAVVRMTHEEYLKLTNPTPEAVKTPLTLSEQMARLNALTAENYQLPTLEKPAVPTSPEGPAGSSRSKEVIQAKFDAAVNKLTTIEHDYQERLDSTKLRIEDLKKTIDAKEQFVNELRKDNKVDRDKVVQRGWFEGNTDFAQRQKDFDKAFEVTIQTQTQELASAIKDLASKNKELKSIESERHQAAGIKNKLSKELIKAASSSSAESSPTAPHSTAESAGTIIDGPSRVFLNKLIAERQSEIRDENGMEPSAILTIAQEAEATKRAMEEYNASEVVHAQEALREATTYKTMIASERKNIAQALREADVSCKLANETGSTQFQFNYNGKKYLGEVAKYSDVITMLEKQSKTTIDKLLLKQKQFCQQGMKLATNS
jgi:hypothetical protein